MTSPRLTCDIRPDGSSSRLYVLLSVSTRTATTTPSSHGMRSDSRTSRFNPHERVTEAILSRTTAFTSALPPPLQRRRRQRRPRRRLALGHPRDAPPARATPQARL